MSDAVGGDAAACERFSATLYRELRTLASRYANRQPASPSALQPTALVHEAMLRLLGGGHVDDKSRTHFVAAAAVAMRCVLVDEARARKAAKRGGGAAQITLDTRDAAVSDAFVDVIALSDLLDRLAKLSPRAAKVVEMRVFAGMTSAEIAGALDVSIPTVKGDWRTARAWLRAELKQGYCEGT